MQQGELVEEWAWNSINEFSNCSYSSLTINSYMQTTTKTPKNKTLNQEHQNLKNPYIKSIYNNNTKLKLQKSLQHEEITYLRLININFISPWLCHSTTPFNNNPTNKNLDQNLYHFHKDHFFKDQKSILFIIFSFRLFPSLYLSICVYVYIKI